MRRMQTYGAWLDIKRMLSKLKQGNIFLIVTPEYDYKFKLISKRKPKFKEVKASQVFIDDFKEGR